LIHKWDPSDSIKREFKLTLWDQRQRGKKMREEKTKMIRSGGGRGRSGLGGVALESDTAGFFLTYALATDHQSLGKRRGKRTGGEEEARAREGKRGRRRGTL